MAKLYKKVKLFISRAYYHGGSGLENCGLRFYRSMDEYKTEAEKEGWFKDESSYKSSWCTKPHEVEVLVSSKAYGKFTDGVAKLSMSDVFIPTSAATQIHRIGGWQ